MIEFYEPIKNLQNDLKTEIDKINDYWLLNQIKILLVNLQNED